jgi:hypothetical protein
MMGARFAKHIHHACQRFINSRTHVERFDSEPGRINADHFTSSRSNSAHSCAAEAGHSMLRRRPLRRTSMRITPVAGLAGSETGMNCSISGCVSTAAVGCMAMGAFFRSAFVTQLRNMFAFKPRANA